MTSIPPRAATWLLMRLGTGPQLEGLLGDLMEQYQTRRSRLWYWSQVITAIGAGAVQDLGTHMGVGLRAIAVWYALSWAAAWATTSLHQSLGLIVWNWTVSHGLDTVRVAWFGRPRFGSPLLLTMACFNSAWIGWMLVRRHRRHAAATMLSCLTFSALYALFVRYAWMQMWPLTFFVSAPFVAPIPFFVGAIGVPLSFVTGALMGAEPAIDPQRRRLDASLPRQ